MEEVQRKYSPQVTRMPGDVQKFMMKIGKQHFPVYFGRNKLNELVSILKNSVAFDVIYLGYDTNTKKHCAPLIEPILKAHNIKFFSYTMKPGEGNKTLDTFSKICKHFLENGGTRQSIVMPIGGGIVANTFGFAAASLFRGIRLVQCPTSFLNAHDAAASSMKQAVNHCGFKNVVGVFHCPTLALVDMKFFDTLPIRELKAGMGELVKNAALFGGSHYQVVQATLMKDETQWTKDHTMLESLTFSGLCAKDMLLEHDPKEKTLAIVFEYGHTIGHGIEIIDGMDLSHGEAVALGMLGASHISTKLNIMTPEDRKKHDAMVYALKPQATTLPERDFTDEVMMKVKRDNKRGYIEERAGFCPFILLKKVGKLHKPNKYYLEYVPDDIVREAIKFVIDYMREN